MVPLPGGGVTVVVRGVASSTVQIGSAVAARLVVIFLQPHTAADAVRTSAGALVLHTAVMAGVGLRPAAFLVLVPVLSQRTRPEDRLPRGADDEVDAVGAALVPAVSLTLAVPDAGRTRGRALRVIVALDAGDRLVCAAFRFHVVPHLPRWTLRRGHSLVGAGGVGGAVVAELVHVVRSALAAVDTPRPSAGTFGRYVTLHTGVAVKPALLGILIPVITVRAGPLKGDLTHTHYVTGAVATELIGTICQAFTTSVTHGSCSLTVHNLPGLRLIVLSMGTQAQTSPQEQDQAKT